MLQTIQVDGRAFSFSGEENDKFFQKLPEFAAGNERLGAFVKNHLRKDAVCLDIGANIGLTSLLFAHYCSVGATYAFEPSPVNAKNLRANLERAGLSNAVVVEAAAGAAPAFVNFTLPKCGAHATVRRSDRRTNPYIQVPVVVIDDWLAERGVGPVDFIKIDVEGFEPEVLAGAARTIVAQRPTLFMEFNSITTMFEARLNPVIFAEAIWSLFDVSLLDAEGSPQPAPTAREFVFRNITERGCVDDLVLRVKDGVTREQIIATMPATPPTQQA